MRSLIPEDVGVRVAAEGAAGVANWLRGGLRVLRKIVGYHIAGSLGVLEAQGGIVCHLQPDDESVKAFFVSLHISQLGTLFAIAVKASRGSQHLLHAKSPQLQVCWHND